MSSSGAVSASPAANTLYRTIWRWHFYAGLFVIPFIVFLSTTGSIYLFRPQIEAWLDQPYDNMAKAQTATPSKVAAAVLAQNPGWRLSKYQLPTGPNSAAQVLISRDGVERRLYVDRSNLKVVHSIDEQHRPMMVLFRLHGQLLAGDRGSNLVELAASWAIVMIVTGLILWWPRGIKGLGGVLYPRLGRGGRITLRDLHAVTGMWISIIALGFLFSGLPWASNWGHYLQTIRVATGTAPTTASWFAGPGDEARARKTDDAAATRGEHAEHMASMHMMPAQIMQQTKAFSVPEGLDRAFEAASAQNFAPPVILMAPIRGGATWKAVSQSLNVPQTAMATIDGRTGEIVRRTGFAQRHWVDRFFGYTTAIHQGQLFGWLNQLMNLCFALCLIGVSVTAVLMWWRRRSPGSLGAPASMEFRGFSWGLTAAIIGFGIVLPEFFVSLLFVLLVEKLVLRRLPRVRSWLALPAN